MESYLRRTYQRALVTLAGLTIFSLINSVGRGSFSSPLIEITFGWISLILLVIFTLFSLAVWTLGKIQGLQSQSYLNSERPVVYWTDTSDELQQMKDNHG